MRKFILIGILFSVVFTNPSLAQEEIYPALSRKCGINLLDPTFAWKSPNPETKIHMGASFLQLESKTTSGGIYNQKSIHFSLIDYPLLIIEMKTSKDGVGEISLSIGKLGFTKDRSYNFYLGKPGKYHTYYLNLGDYNRKFPVVDHILFFPYSGPGSAEVRVFKFVKGSLWEKICAGWQEFWGPQGRGFTGKTFLIIKSPQLFGRPIFFYFNWLIVIFLFGSLLFKRPKWTLFLILALWIFLEVGSAVNNWLFFQYDLRFWGKSLDEKREIQNKKDFYRFIKFAEEKIPASASFDLLANPKYPYSIERASYYLYPRKYSKNATYLLVFDEKPDKETWTKYKMRWEFRPGAYICILNY